MTPTIRPHEFLKYVRQRNIFGYNQKLVGMIFDTNTHLFDGATILDAGAGRRLKHFKGQLADARRLVGIDVSLPDLSQNRDIDDRVLGDAERLPFSTKPFDCILSVDVVEHLEDPGTFFHEAARCLRPGGVLVVCTPNLLGYKSIVTSLSPRPALDWAWRTIKGAPGQPHRTFFRANTLNRLHDIGDECGFTIEHAHYVNEVSHFFYPYPILAVLAYLYGRLLEQLGLRFLLNYMVCILRRTPPNARPEQDVTQLELSPHRAPA